jgi:ribose transport system substrate-binding protein
MSKALLNHRIAGALTGLGLVLALGACGGGDSTSAGEATPASAASSTTASGGSGLAAIKAQVAKDEAGDVVWPAPKEAFDPGAKKAMVIACGFQAPVCAAAAKEGVKAVEAMGWSTPAPQDGQLAPQTQAGLVTKAAQQGYDAIVMYGIDVNSIKSAIEQAVAKKVAISCIVCDSGALRGKVIDATPDFTKQGEQMGRYLIAKNEGEAKVVAFQDSAFPQTSLRTSGLKKVLDADCPDCSLEVKQQSVGETAKPGPPTFTALLSATRPGDLTDVVALYDGIGLPMATTLKSRGLKTPVVDGYDAEQPVLQGMKGGSLPYGATIGSPVDYATWAAVDEVGRQVAGKPTWDATALPTVLVTKDNAAKYTGAQFQPSGDWRSTFTKLWGKG